MELYLCVILLMSLITFLLYSVDKKRSIKNQWRIKESTLLLCSFLFGSLGGVIAMNVLRHKTKHWYFVVVNYGSLIVHIIVGLYIYKKVGFLFI